MSPFRPLVVRLLYFALSLFLFGMDRGTKALVVRRLPLYESVPVVKGFFHITHVANTGALFGLLAGIASPLRGLVFITVPVLAIALILFFQIRSREGDLLTQLGLSLILGGALGNLYDRIRFGHVVDFLDFSVAGHHWPAFNIADSCICLGVFTLVLDLYRREQRPAPAS
jgi:signal peptidase II